MEIAVVGSPAFTLGFQLAGLSDLYNPEAAVARVDELDQSAGWQRLGAGIHLDLVREHPRIALAGALVASGLQANLRQRGDAFGQGGHRRHSKALSGENEPL